MKNTNDVTMVYVLMGNKDLNMNGGECAVLYGVFSSRGNAERIARDLRRAGEFSSFEITACVLDEAV